MAQCLISFGSNLGDRHVRIADAARMIDRDISVLNFSTSRLFQTPPIGGPGGQEPFLNGVAAFDTDASAAEILSLLQNIENRLGRQRKLRWSARSIDLDVVLHGELIGGNRSLVVPHPRYTARRFVLRPAVDVAAHYRDPRFGWTLKQLADHLDQGVASMALVGSDFATRRALCDSLEQDHGIRVFRDTTSHHRMEVIGNAPLPASSAAAAMKSAGERQRPSFDQEEARFDIEASVKTAWIADFVPPLPTAGSEAAARASTPRVTARLQRTAPDERWPAPHQMWPAGWAWPEYRLEMDDFQWATSEVVSALQSMRCPIEPVTEDGNWWK